MSGRAKRGRFVGRARELAALERQYRSSRPVLLPIYGRRRVGKSELLVHFCEGKRAVYHAATEGTPAQQLRAFMRSAAEAYGKPVLAEIAVRDWEHALTRVMEEAPRGRRQVLVLDEFQWLCESSPELPSVLQKLWDRQWQHQKAPFIVLCGSYLGFMEREVLGHQSPLFGRRTGQLKLEPFGYLEAAGFHPGWSLEDQARAWFICGGVPTYLKAFAADRSVEQNIVEQFLEVDAPLMREAEFLLREELRDVASYTTVVEAMAQGFATPTTIAQFAGIPVPQLIYFLNTLQGLGYAEKRLPLVPGRPSRKLTRYAIGDPLLRFWFRFVAPHFSSIRRGPADAAFTTHVAPHLQAFYGAGFEALCREALALLWDHERVRAPGEVGEFWSPGSQIDVVGLRKDRWVELGECKWGEVRSPAAVLDELRAKVAHYPAGGSTVQLRVFTRKKGRAANPPGVKLHSLAELYALDPRKGPALQP
jgi:AAA+ ATPase superfamily predicted ATPase